MLLTPCSGFTQANKSGVYIKEGTPAPFAGYLFNERTTRDIANGWRESEENFKILSRAYDDLKRESLESIDALNKEIITLNDAILEDARKARRAHRRRSFWNTASVILIGGAIGAVIHNNR